MGPEPSHSPNMITRHDAHNTLHIRRTVDDGTMARPRIKDAVISAISNADHQSEILFELSNASKILGSCLAE